MVSGFAVMRAERRKVDERSSNLTSSGGWGIFIWVNQAEITSLIEAEGDRQRL